MRIYMTDGSPATDAAENSLKPAEACALLEKGGIIQLGESWFKPQPADVEFLLGQKQVRDQVRTHYRVLPFGPRRQGCHVPALEPNPFGDFVSARVFSRDSDRRRIEINGFDRIITELSGADREDPGSGAEV